MWKGTLAALLSLVGAAGCLTGCSGSKPHLGESAQTVASADGVSVSRSDSRYLTSDGKLGGTEDALIHAEAVVDSIDFKSRKFTIQAGDGRLTTLTAPDTIRNFGQIRAGDRVAVEYGISVEFEARPPTGDELAISDTAIAASARAQLGQKPGMALVEQNTRIVTVESIDRSKDLLTVRSRSGDITTIKAKYPQNLSLLKTGDTIVVRIIEALAAAVVPLS